MNIIPMSFPEGSYRVQKEGQRDKEVLESGRKLVVMEGRSDCSAFGLGVQAIRPKESERGALKGEE